MNVLIVDDEQYIVDYLKNILPWQRFGFYNVKGYHNSVEAKQYLLECSPELLITDIRMPVVSGLDLAKLVVEHQLPTRIIMLSGYSDFTYAQQALRLGVVDYLVKPIQAQDLVAAVQRVRETFSLQDNIELTNERFKQVILKALSSQTVATEIEDNLFLNQGIALIPHYYTKYIQEAIGNEYITVLPLSHTIEGIEVKPFNFQNLYELLSCKLVIYSKNNGLYLRDYQQLVQQNKWEQLLMQLKNINSVGVTQLDIDILYDLTHYFSDILQNMNLLEVLQTGALHTYLIDFIENIVMEKDSTRDMHKKAVETIVTYIQDNSGESITLDQLSELVYMHPVTVSRIFKSTTGVTLSQYIMKMRLENAAKLLSQSELRISDIAQVVGYKKTQYFIQLFKKNYGMTPQQYRRHVRLGG